VLHLSWLRHAFGQRCKPVLKSRWFWAVVGVTALGLALRAYHLGHGALWYDEAFSALAAEQPFAQMIDATAYDVHPPLYYAILWAWFRLWPGLGRPSEWWLRLPSLLFSALSIPLTWSFARGFNADRRAALLAATLMAVLPFQIFYGQETRQYSLLLLVSLLTVVCWQRRWWSGLCVGLIGCAYTHNLGVIWAGTFGLLILINDRENWRHILWAGFGAGLAYLPWAIRLIVQLSQWGTVGYWLPPVTPGGFFYAFHALLWNEHTLATIVNPGMILSACLVVLAVVQRPALSILKQLFIVPPLVIAVISILVQPIFFSRGLIYITPAFCTLIAVGLFKLPKVPQLTMATVICFTLGTSLHSYYHSPTLQKWPHREWANIITQGWREGDRVLCAAKCLPFIWYLPQAEIVTLPYVDDHLHCVLSPGTMQAMAIDEIDEIDDLDGSRLWFIFTNDASTTWYQWSVREQLDAKYPTLFRHTFLTSRIADGEITLYDMETIWTND